MKANWTDTALDHLRAIHAYIARNSPQYASASWTAGVRYALPRTRINRAIHTNRHMRHSLDKV